MRGAGAPWPAVLLVAALLIVAYWVAWLAHRSLVASETGAAYTQFEDAFPLADGWLALCLVAASYCLVTARRAALFWLLAGGGAGLYLFAMDVLYDLQHGVWGKGANGLIELVINLVTLGLSVFVLHWTWIRRTRAARRPMSDVRVRPRDLRRADAEPTSPPTRAPRGGRRRQRAQGGPVARPCSTWGPAPGETLAAVLARHAGATAVGVDENAAHARRRPAERLAGLPVELHVADLRRPAARRPLRPRRLRAGGPPPRGLGEGGALRPRRPASCGPAAGSCWVTWCIPVDPADAVTPVTDGHDQPSTWPTSCAGWPSRPRRRGGLVRARPGRRAGRPSRLSGRPRRAGPLAPRPLSWRAP